MKILIIICLIVGVMGYNPETNTWFVYMTAENRTCEQISINTCTSCGDVYYYVVCGVNKGIEMAGIKYSDCSYTKYVDNSCNIPIGESIIIEAYDNACTSLSGNFEECLLGAEVITLEIASFGEILLWFVVILLVILAVCSIIGVIGFLVYKFYKFKQYDEEMTMFNA